VKEKTFYKILLEFTFSIEKTKRRIADLRLTTTEKLIIEGHLNIRKNLNQEVLKTFSETSPSDLSFVESQRQLILGSALNNLSRFIEAEKHILKSIEILQKFEAPFFVFYSYHLLFTIYLNLNQPASMLKTIQAMKEIPKSQRQETLFLICEFCYEQEVGNHSAAMNFLKEIDLRMGDLTEGDVVRQLVNKFSFFVMLEELQQAGEVLAELKQFRNYQLSENYNFMKKMLDHLTDGSPLYIYDHLFQNVPVLLHQLKVIQGLEEKNLDSARSHWEKLKVISPSTYGKAFEYHGSTCLFSLGLRKHSHAEKVPMNLAPVGENKVDQLYSLLTLATVPMHASMIYELLWGSSPETKEDFKKVSRLISRVKKEKNVEIEFRKGVYSLVTVKKSQAS
jgi:tetratricopeptide (TPR) repeat protein